MTFVIASYLPWSICCGLRADCQCIANAAHSTVMRRTAEASTSRRVMATGVASGLLIDAALLEACCAVC